MRVLGLALYKALEICTTVYQGLNIKNMEAWLMTAYVNWWPLLARLFQ
jgi:hypothetical protein